MRKLLLCAAIALSALILIQVFPAAVQQWRFVRVFAAPIKFYGRALDQNGDPVAGANVEIQVNDRPWESASPHYATSDANGVFSIARLSGLSLYVKVSKPGYYRVLKRGGKPGSDGGFAYGTNLGDGIHRPDPKKPAIFILHKPGVIEPLVRQNEIDRRVEKNGSPKQLGFGDGNPSHAITFQCWTDDANKSVDRLYDWRFKVSVPNGGLVVREGIFAFEAPLEGYQQLDEHFVSKALPDDKWKDSVEKSYFVRFNDNVYARIDVRMIAHGSHFVVFSGYLNPKAGSRNLVADPLER